MDFESEIILENDRVRLTPLIASDINLLLPYSINEPELWEFSLLPGDGEENLSKYITLALEARKNKDSYPFLVYDKVAQKFAGTTRLYDFQIGHNKIKFALTKFF